MFSRNPYNYDVEAESESTALDCSESIDRTRQEFREECDINTIAKRFGLGATLPTVHDLPQFGDYEGVFDFQTAMNAIRQAEQAFAAQPARVRERFANDPQRFLEFCEDPRNRAEALDLGLLDPSKVAPAPSVAQPPPSTPPAS